MTQHLAAPPEVEPTKRPPLWRDRNFLLLWGGQTVSELGIRISGIAIPLLATNELEASVFQISMLAFLAWLPYLLFSLPAGMLADRVDQRKLMIVCDLGRMALMVSIPLVALLWDLTLPYLYAVVGLSGILTVLFSVSYRSMLPRIVAADQLVDANAKLGMSQDFAEFAGATVGGALIGLVGAAKTFFSNGIAYLVSAATLWLIREAPAGRESAPLSGDRVSPRAAVTGGLAFIRRQPILLKILACTTTSNFFGGLLLYSVGLAAFSGNVALYNAAATSYRQHVTPPNLLGRVNASFLWICFGVIPLGALFGGTLGSQLGLRTTLWVCVLGTWSAALFVLFSPLRRMRDLPGG